MRAKQLPQDIFQAHKDAGRELTLGEIRRTLTIGRVSREALVKAMKTTKRIFRQRWHEIYDANLGVVHTPAPEPIQAQEEPAIDPLVALKKARKKREEHE